MADQQHRGNSQGYRRKSNANPSREAARRSSTTSPIHTALSTPRQKSPPRGPKSMVGLVMSQPTRIKQKRKISRSPELPHKAPRLDAPSSQVLTNTTAELVPKSSSVEKQKAIEKPSSVDKQKAIDKPSSVDQQEAVRQSAPPVIAGQVQEGVATSPSRDSHVVAQQTDASAVKAVHLEQSIITRSPSRDPRKIAQRVDPSAVKAVHVEQSTARSPSRDPRKAARQPVQQNDAPTLEAGQIKEGTARSPSRDPRKVVQPAQRIETSTLAGAQVDKSLRSPLPGSATIAKQPSQVNASGAKDYHAAAHEEWQHELADMLEEVFRTSNDHVIEKNKAEQYELLVKNARYDVALFGKQNESEKRRLRDAEAKENAQHLRATQVDEKLRKLTRALASKMGSSVDGMCRESLQRLDSAQKKEGQEFKRALQQQMDDFKKESLDKQQAHYKQHAQSQRELDERYQAEKQVLTDRLDQLTKSDAAKAIELVALREQLSTACSRIDKLATQVMRLSQALETTTADLRQYHQQAKTTAEKDLTMISTVSTRLEAVSTGLLLVTSNISRLQDDAGAGTKAVGLQIEALSTRLEEAKADITKHNSETQPSTEVPEMMQSLKARLDKVEDTHGSAVTSFGNELTTLKAELDTLTAKSAAGLETMSSTDVAADASHVRRLDQQDQRCTQIQQHSQKLELALCQLASRMNNLSTGNVATAILTRLAELRPEVSYLAGLESVWAKLKEQELNISVNWKLLTELKYEVTKLSVLSKPASIAAFTPAVYQTTPVLGSTQAHPLDRQDSNVSQRAPDVENGASAQ